MADIKRQLQQRLDSLAAAGIDWLPRGHVVAYTSPTAEPDMPKAKTPKAKTPSAPPVTIALPEALIGDVTTQLTLLAKEIAGCKKCPELFSTRTQTVFGVGPVAPELCFIGEAPGADEDAKGEPFVGRAGQLLDKIIVAMGLQRSEVYICNTLKCRPPNNATPTPVQCANCRPYFEKQIDLIKPKWICCLGATALRNVLSIEPKQQLNLGQYRGKIHSFRGINVVATYHPAYLLRNPSAKADVWNDMKFLLTQMGRPIPDVKKT
ncbi:hypothetical protein BH11PLA2_BH11PLA2_47510 [soil metagenome]